MTTTGPAAGIAEDVRIAALHLRLGQLGLARAELEDLDRRGSLDVEGTGLLAEARWRMGAADAAIDAAEAHLESGGTAAACVAIAAESAWSDGRTDEAQALMRRLSAISPADLDAVFAGMPRRAAWPTAGEHPEAAAASREEVTTPRRTIPGPREVIDAEPGALAKAAEPAGPQAGRRGSGARPRGHVDPAAELRRAREELGSRPDRALVRLALVLRLDPTLAPVVLDTVSLRREPLAAVIRGDAQRLLGRHLEAEAAFDAAVESLEVP